MRTPPAVAGLLAALLALALAAGPRAARAETTEQQAEALAARAVTMARAGDLAKAAALFEAAYALDPAPILLYNVGRVKARLGDLNGARAALARYVELEPDAEARTRGREALAEVDARIAAAAPSPGVSPEPVVTVLKKPEPPDEPAVEAFGPPAGLEASPSPRAVEGLAPSAPVTPDRTWTWVWIGSGAAVLVAGAVTTAVLLATRSSGPAAPDGVLTIGKPLEAAR